MEHLSYTKFPQYFLQNDPPFLLYLADDLDSSFDYASRGTDKISFNPVISLIFA